MDELEEGSLDDSKLHDAHSALVEGFFTSELSDEEWALLQLHMAYSDLCETAFLKSSGRALAAEAKDCSEFVS